MTSIKKEIMEEWDKEFRPFFANWATVCVKCNHIADAHYWNGGGDAQYSGYDACHTCGCVDYDRKTDFVDKILDYNEEGYSRFTAFLSQALTRIEKAAKAELREKMMRYTCDFDWDFEKGKAKNKSYVALDDVLKLFSPSEEKEERYYWDVCPLCGWGHIDKFDCQSPKKGER